MVLLATSAGESRDLPGGSLENFYSAEWFPDGKRILLTGSEPGHGLRCYVQNSAAGFPVPQTPEGTYDCHISSDTKFIVAKGPKDKVSLYQMPDGKPVPAPGGEPEDQLIRFENDGQHLYVYKQGDSETTVYRLDIKSGRREVWKHISLPDPVVDSVDSVVLTPDGKWYVCTYRRTISNLYLVDGLK
jgi:hypothetical protein